MPQRRERKDLEYDRGLTPLFPKHENNHRSGGDEQKTEERGATPQNQINYTQIVSCKQLRIVLNSAECGNGDIGGGTIDLVQG